MTISLLALLLQQEPKGLSKVVIVAAALAFALGVFLVVYFYRRFRATEKEPEEDWQAGMHALFVEPGKKVETAPKRPPLNASSTRAQQARGTPQPAAPRLIGQRPPVQQEANSEPRPSIQQEVKPEQRPGAEQLGKPQSPPLSDAALPVQPERVSYTEPPAVGSDAATLVFGSPDVAKIQSDAVAEESSPFDEDVFAGFDTAIQPGASQTTEVKAADGGETSHFASPELTSQVRAPRATEPFDAARTAVLNEPSRRESYEPPTITPVNRREAFEPPSIRPLEPRDQTNRGVEIMKSSSISNAAKPRKAAAAPAATAGSVQASSPRPRKPAGSVLGIPAEASKAPMKLGTPSRPRADVGIGALVNYGKESDPAGHGGTIVLAVVALLVAGSVLAYLYVPSINAKVTTWVARMRGTDKEEAQAAAAKPKAVIFPSRNMEVAKNMVKARGAVDNTSDPPETLENLSVEVSLLPAAGGQPSTRKIPLDPPTLAPGQRGIFEFEYDGKRDTGFTGFKIVKLWSGDTEIKFNSPNQNR